MLLTRFVARCATLLIVGLPAALASAQAAPAANEAAATKPDGPRIAWETDFDAALQRAASEKKPLFVAFLMDNEPANDLMLKDHYTDPQIVKLLGHFVCLAGCIGNHASTDGCSKFPGVTCAQHEAIEGKARKLWLTDDLVETPQHLGCDPTGKLLHRRIYLLSKPALVRMLLMTMRDCGIDTKGFTFDFPKDLDSPLPEADSYRVDSWLKDLNSRNLEVRQTALRGLAWADDPRALPAVLACCDKKRDGATRQAAINALARKGNHQAVAKLGGLLLEGDPQITDAVAATLETIELATAAPVLLAALKREKRDRVQAGLVRAAAKCQPNSTELRDWCLKHHKGASQHLLGSLLIAMGRLKTDDALLTALIASTATKNQSLRGLAVWAVGNHRGPKARKALVDLQQAEKAPQVLEILTAALKHNAGEASDGYDTKYLTFFYGL